MAGNLPPSRRPCPRGNDQKPLSRIKFTNEPTYAAPAEKSFLSEKRGRTIAMIEGKKTTVGHRNVDHLPNPSALPVHQCSQYTECTHQAPPRKICHEVVGPRRHGIRRTKGRQETRHCDVIDVMPSCGCHWSILPISSDACDDWGRWRGGGTVSCWPEP